MTSKLVVNTIEADTGISSVSFASSISMNSTAKFHFSAAGIDIGADTNINRPSAGVLGFNINSSEKARIDSSGRVLIGTTTEGSSSADDLTVATSGTTGITIRSGTSNNGNIEFSDGTSGQDEYRGIVQYAHSDNSMRFYTNATEKLRITSDGDVAIGRDAALNNYAAGSTTTQLAVVKDGGAAGSGYHEVAHFTGGNDSNDTGAIVRITQFNNDRGLYIKGGRGTSDQAKAIFGLRNSANSDSDVMTFLQGGSVGINEATPLARLHVKNGESNASGYAHDTIVVEDSDHAFLTFLTGTSGSSGINFGDAGDPQRGVIQYDQNNDYMRFVTAAGERLRITSGGKIGINYAGTPPSEDVMICTSGQASGAGLSLSHLSGGNRYGVRLQSITGTNQGLTISRLFNSSYTEIFKLDSTGQITSTANTNGQIIHSYKNTNTTAGSSAMTVEQWFRFNRTGSGMDSPAAKIIAGKEREWVGGAANQDGYLAFHTMLNESSAEKVRITSDGKLLVGTTSSTASPGSGTGYSNVCTFNFPGITLTHYGVVASFMYGGIHFTNSQYFVSNGTTGVYLGNGNTSWTAHSDERLKTNITELDGTKAYNHIKTARATSFKWNATGYPTDKKIGFIAQDWETNYPELVNSTTETIDSVENPKGIQYTETVPVLMAALKQAISKIETLEAEVAALKGS